MRKVNIQVQSIDADTLFARGVQQIIADKEKRPTDYLDYELAAMLRKEQALSKKCREKPVPGRVSAFDLFQPFFRGSVFGHA